MVALMVHRSVLEMLVSLSSYAEAWVLAGGARVMVLGLPGSSRHQ